MHGLDLKIRGRKTFLLDCVYLIKLTVICENMMVG